MFPQIFGKYVLERLIAVGGMARVFLATLRGAGGFEKKLVVKQIRAELAIDEAFVQRFVAEAKTTVELSHPNIVPVYELGVEQGVYYLAMELCDGVTLAELVEKTGKLTPDEGAYVGIEICRGLDYAHRKARIIHRDVTPRNVIVDEEGGIRLIDFGIAAPAFLGAKEVFGSPGHMPPEQLEGGEMGPPTDVFAAAVLLYEIWSGTAPFRRATPEASKRALSEHVPALSTFDGTLAPLDELVASALSRDAKRRPQSAEDLSRPLRRFTAGKDSGDVAKKLGARVAGLRAKASAESSTPVDAAPERISSPDVTRTFATRPLDVAPVPSTRVSGAAGSDLSTRKMNEDQAGWSTGDRRASRKRYLGTLGATGALLVIVAGSAALLRNRAITADGPTPRGSTSVEAPNDASPVATSPLAVAPSEGGPNPIAEETSPLDASAHLPSAAPIDQPSHLRIFANPQGTVEIDGRARGAAPIADLVVAPGSHFVRLDCAPLGEAVSQNVRVESGETVTISGDFTGAHGRILVRRTAPNPGLNP